MLLLSAGLFSFNSPQTRRLSAMMGRYRLALEGSDSLMRFGAGGSTSLFHVRRWRARGQTERAGRPRAQAGRT